LTQYVLSTSGVPCSHVAARREGPRAQADLAAAVAATSRQVGASLGVALSGTIASVGASQHGGSSDFPAATHAFWWLMVGCGITVIVLGLVSTGSGAAASVRRIAALLDDAPGELR
jgi:hypothetical protein